MSPARRARPIRWLCRQLRDHRTFALEFFLALESLFVGAWVMWPFSNAFGQVVALGRIPEPITGGVMILHGCLSIRALWKLDVHLCRRSALISTALWSLFAAGFCITPPRAAVTIPLVVLFALASVWVYLRLAIKYGDAPRAP